MITKQPKHVALALGSNLGERREKLSYALDQLRRGGLTDLRCAQILESDPLDCPPGSAPYLNSVACGFWSGTAEELLNLALAIEHQAGRKRSGLINEPRELDIDILLIDQESHLSQNLQVPHPRMTERCFVLQPLTELAPDWIIPGTGLTVETHLRRLMTHV